MDSSGSAVLEHNLNDISTPEGEPNPSFDPLVVVSLVTAEEGGTVSNGRVTLEFPAGALDKDTHISMRMVGASYLQVEFAPHGIVFNEPVLMRLNLAGTVADGQAESTPIQWWNPGHSRWDDIETLTPENPNESRALLEHFSRYGGING